MKYAFTFAALVAAVSAQSPVGAYGQCGGSPWTGSTTCVAGYYCNAYSQWYSQCIPGTASSVKTTTTTTTSKPASSTTTKPPSSTTVVTTTTKPSSTTVVTTTKPITTTAVSSTTTAVSSPTAAPSGSIPYASGTSFVIDGKKQYFAGTNSYWIGFLTNNADVDLVMSHLAEAGEKVLRVWGFNDVTSIPSADTVYYQSFINGVASINTGPNGLQRLDYVVKSAEAHGIKLIINFVNNWKDYGGEAAYFSYAGISSNQEWYVSAKAQAQYQAYIKAVVSRYPNSPAIFAWELSNEARCNGCATSVLANWVAKTAAYIKSLDSKHMVTTGEEGMGLPGDGSYPYQYGEGGNFTATCSDPNIDFCTYHLYPDSWSVSPAKEWGNAWIQAHAKICLALNKPCVLEEFGQMNTCASELAWETTALNTPGNAGDMFWQYGDTLSWGQTSQDGNTVYYKDALWQCLVAPHIADIMAKGA